MKEPVWAKKTNLEVSVEVHVEQQMIAVEIMGRDRVATSPKSLGVRYSKPGRYQP
jgi:hypothetical protein